MAKLISARELSLADIAEIDTKLADALMSDASKKLALDKSKLALRPILPTEDLGITNNSWYTGSLTANSWNTWINAVLLDDDTFLGIMGIASLAAVPKTSVARFSIGVGARVFDIWEVEDAYISGEPAAYTPEPIIYPGASRVTVDLCAKAAGVDNVILKGWVVEPKGKRVA